MTESAVYNLQVVSTLSVLIPLLAGLILLKQSSQNTRLFTLFLLVGLIADVSGWCFSVSGNYTGSMMSRYGYNLFEPIFLCWLVSTFFKTSIIRKVLVFAWIIVVPFWALTIHYYELFAVYKTITQVLLAFATSFCLLDMVEKQENSPTQFWFWAMIGLFFYNFSTFFFMSLVMSNIGVSLWYMHNTINILTNLIFFWAFIQIWRSRSSS
jgi:hypothetical protein